MTLPTLWNRDNYFRGRSYQGREATKGRVLEFVADIANKHNLSLVELTVFPMAVNHESLTVRTSVCNMWSTYLDKVNQKESYPLSQECVQIFNCLIS
jgi:hypothetical protein